MSYDGGRLTPIQVFFLTAGFLFGTTPILARPGTAEQDSWLAVLLGGVVGLLYLLLYLDLLGRYPGRTLLEIAQLLLGKMGGRLFGVLFFWYSLQLSALTARVFAEVLSGVFMVETPLLAFIVAMLILSSVAVRSGIETIARTTEVSFISGPIWAPWIITALAAVNGLIVPGRLLPLLDHDLKTILQDTISATATPFGEMVILTMVLGLANDFPAGRRAALWGAAMEVLVLVMVMAREIMVLGGPEATRLVFPSIITIKMVQIGDFLTRVEVIFMLAWTISTFIKLSLCQYAAVVSLGQILGLAEFRPLTLPLAGLIGGLALLLVENVLEMIEFLNYYGLYALPFQFLLPLFLWILARRKPAAPQAQTTEPVRR